MFLIHGKKLIQNVLIIVLAMRDKSAGEKFFRRFNYLAKNQFCP